MRALALLLSLAPLPLAAQTFGLPPGCTAFLTVQTANCTVEHFFTCADDPDGYLRRIELYADGFDFLTTSDAEGQWIESIDAFTGTQDRLEPAPADPGLWSELLDDGVDSYDFRTIGADGTATRFVGTDKLTGAVVVIGGRELTEMVTEMRAEDPTGATLWSMTSTTYIDAQQRLSFGGIVNWIVPAGSPPTDDTPMAFAGPGEDGFLSAVPQYGCTDGTPP
jgi:hypothetical protein